MKTLHITKKNFLNWYFEEDYTTESGKIREEVQKILDDYNNNYKHLNRNDKCTCGSGKKFKQCHLVHFKEYLYL